MIQDRRKFGPLGWNIRYDFTDGDLNMCQRQIKMMIDDYEEIPYKVIRVLCGEINYGGRVTDDKDRRLMNNLLNNYIIPEVLTDDFTFSPSPTYRPKAQNVEELSSLSSLPLIPQPESSACTRTPTSPATRTDTPCSRRSYPSNPEPPRAAACPGGGHRTRPGHLRSCPRPDMTPSVTSTPPTTTSP